MDIFSFSPSATVASCLSSQISTGGRIRVVIAPGDPTVAATYAGFSNTDRRCFPGAARLDGRFGPGAAARTCEQHGWRDAGLVTREQIPAGIGSP